MNLWWNWTGKLELQCLQFALCQWALTDEWQPWLHTEALGNFVYVVESHEAQAISKAWVAWVSFNKIAKQMFFQGSAFSNTDELLTHQLAKHFHRKLISFWTNGSTHRGKNNTKNVDFYTTPFTLSPCFMGWELIAMLHSFPVICDWGLCLHVIVPLFSLHHCCPDFPRV